MSKPFIALDWGTSSFRAYLVDRQGWVQNRIASAEGILSVKDGAFDVVLESHIGQWDRGLPIVASGMITSRQGWIECDYAECPAGAETLANTIRVHETLARRTVHFITGLHLKSPTIGHDVMRGEETEVVGSLSSGAQHFVTPGTHSKWIDVVGSEIVNFATYMTGESFALYRNHSILSRLMAGTATDEATFHRGLERAFADPAGLLHALFSARSLGLFKDIAAEGLHSYLSGMLIGAEVAHATAHHDKNVAYQVLGSAANGQAYVTALKFAGLNASYGNPLCVVEGQRLIAEAAGVI